MEISKAEGNAVRNNLYHHSYFNLADSGTFSMEAAAELLGQYWHPLHYFPNFLASLIAQSPDLEFKTCIADILNEELGEGKVERAHEKFYIHSMTSVGFDERTLTDSPPTDITKRLVDCYRRGTRNFLAGLGGLYATESTDHRIVSSIGSLVFAATGTNQPLGWINIHTAQEPNHVDLTGQAMATLDPAKHNIAMKYAEEMWQCWIDFFAELEQRVYANQEGVLA